MTKKQQLEFLKQIANTDAGLAVIDLLEEKVRELKDASNFSKDDFEMDGKASLRAAVMLDKAIREIKRLGGIEVKVKGKYTPSE